MGHPQKNADPTDAIDLSRARLVRRGPGRQVQLSLRGMRQAAGLTQAQVSKASGLAQPEISKLEAASSFDDRQVLTVRRYLAALGDELELVSVSKQGHRIGIGGASEAAPSDADAPSPVEPPRLRAVPEQEWADPRDPKSIETVEALDDLFDGLDWSQKVALASHAFGRLCLDRLHADGATTDAMQAVAVGNEAIKLIAGSEYGDEEVPARVRRMHQQLRDDQRRCIEREVRRAAETIHGEIDRDGNTTTDLASLLSTRPLKKTEMTLEERMVRGRRRLVVHLLEEFEKITGERLSILQRDERGRLSVEPGVVEKVSDLLKLWRATPKTRKKDLTAIGVMAGVFRLAGKPGTKAQIRRRYAARAARTHK